MGQPYDITMKLESTGEVIRITGKIPSEAWATLLRFRDEANEFLADLKECENLNVSFSLKGNPTDGLSAEVRDTVKSRDLAMILHHLRPFLLQNEPLEFNRTVNLLQRYIRHEWMGACFQSLKDLFSGKEFQRQTRITSGELLVNCERTLMTWLNAYEYHRDNDKRRLIKDLDARFPEEFSRSLFVVMVIEKVKAVLRFGDMISSLECRGGSASKLPYYTGDR